MIAMRETGEKREQQDKVKINRLPTGVPGLDEIVGGGFPEFSFNIIAGAPGSGKTTLAHQFVFANATLAPFYCALDTSSNITARFGFTTPF